MTWHTAWDAYDVPRIWDAVRGEDDPLGWEQVRGLQRMAEVLTDHVDGLRAKRETLLAAWQSRAADRLLAHWDGLIDAGTREAAALVVAARGLHGVMAALAAAKRKIEPLVWQWNAITSDWIPDFWDEVAAELNDDARTAMLVAAAEIRDHRERVAPATPRLEPAAPPPALPGHIPATVDGPRLAGMPTPIAAVPGQPVSMLPIPPGNPYAPQGGAYLLPGPGVGPQGFIVSMSPTPPQPPTRYRSAWQVPTGVPPVIQPVSPPGVPTPEEEAEFDDWYTRLATPWRMA